MSHPFNFFQAQQVYGTLFFQFPKVLMYGTKYRSLSAEAKLAYMILKDRLEYSLRNHWIDEQNNVYFVFTNKELQEIFNCSEHKVIKTKKELETAGLLFQKQMGFDPRKKANLANRLYLAELDVDANDVYLRGEKPNNSPESLATSGTAKSAVRATTSKSLATSGTAKSAVRQNRPESLATSGTAKSAVYLDKELKEDTTRNNLETSKLDFSRQHYSQKQVQEQNQDLIAHATEFLSDQNEGMFLESRAVQLLSFWCTSPQQMRRFIGIIINAKNTVQAKWGKPLYLDDPRLKPLLTKALRRYFNALRADDSKVKDVENYLFGTMKNLFERFADHLQQENYLAEHPEKRRQAKSDSDTWYLSGL